MTCGVWRKTLSSVPAVFASLALALSAELLAPAASPAAITTIGSPLSVPATFNTAENLGYAGTDTHVPASREVPTGVVHTYHFGADAALWNTAISGADASVPAAGQALRISLEGCAIPAPGGPWPLTQIHFQSLSPVRGGGVRVWLTSQPFEIPVCGQNGASGYTVSTYEPINLCVRKGDYVAFNDEGGFVEKAYQSGVGYQVIGAVAGSAFDSFIKGNGTNDGALLSALDSTAMDGFALNGHEELMMQVALGTGPDARYVCPGGSKDAPPVLAPLHVRPQTDGVNSQRIVSVAIYCRPAPGCNGTAALTLAGNGRGAGSAGLGLVGHTGFSLPGNKTSHLPIRVSPQLMGLIRARHGVFATLTATMGGQTFTQTIGVRIL